ncbi:MAG: enoyl-CoA hydratase [Gammaproteobacteria bacterium]|nr:enoyl-CoA hydratase [Gammaproteobacteria bacterium]
MIYLASYNGNRKSRSLKAFYNAFQDTLIRVLTKGKYSHCEIAISRKDGKFDCYSSSPRDGGVRYKVMDLPSDRWDLQQITGLKQRDVVSYFNQTQGAKYDWLGAIGVIVGCPDDKSKFFCSEWCYNLLFDSQEGWRFSPVDLFILIDDLQK